MDKIITKMLAGRMKKALGGIINQYQNSILKDGQILDCSLIANEIIDSKFKQGGMHDL